LIFPDKKAFVDVVIVVGVECTCKDILLLLGGPPKMNLGGVNETEWGEENQTPMLNTFTEISVDRTHDILVPISRVVKMLYREKQ
jgi:hypothetical protein